jgi:peptidoglycan/LPS O-acetylase OafA/YrhL
VVDEQGKPVARRVFRILAAGIAVLCFILAAGFVFLPNMGGAELIPIFVASGVVTSGLAWTRHVTWWGSKRQQGDPA